jgi:transcriptional regulator with XRE-family HTH domain
MNDRNTLLCTIPLRAWRAAFGLSQVDLAQASGISQFTIGRIENGKNTQLRTRQRLADVFGVEPEELATEPDPIKHPSKIKRVSNRGRIDKPHVTIHAQGQLVVPVSIGFDTSDPEKIIGAAYLDPTKIPTDGRYVFTIQYVRHDNGVCALHGLSIVTDREYLEYVLTHPPEDREIDPGITAEAITEDDPIAALAQTA